MIDVSAGGVDARVVMIRGFLLAIGALRAVCSMAQTDNGETQEPNWPENAPFHSPVFVLTHERRSRWERRGGTTFHFVNVGIESAKCTNE